jgi:hypothetical protein
VSTLATRDGRTLFERAWAHGIDSGVITEERRDAVLHEGTRAIRRIAGIIGSEYLRADLERAMRAMLGLVNLHLEKVSRGDLAVATRSIADKGLLFHTRGASQAIKRVLAAEAGLNPDELDPGTLARFELAVVSQWASTPFADFARREQGADEVRRRREAAAAIARLLRGQTPDPHQDPDQVIMTALLILAYEKQQIWIADAKGFEKLLGKVRKAPARFATLPAGVPPAHRPVIEAVWTTNARTVLALITDARVPLHQLVAGDPGTNRLQDLLVLPDGSLEDIDGHGDAMTSHWKKVTRGTADESRLLLVMLQGVMGFTAKPPLGWRAAETLLRTTLAEPPPEQPLTAWLDANAPHQYHSGLIDLWRDFWEERTSTLDEDARADDYRRFLATWLPMRAPAKPRPKGPAKVKA